jgi:hypothetical protein
MCIDRIDTQSTEQKITIDACKIGLLTIDRRLQAITVGRKKDQSAAWRANNNT